MTGPYSERQVRVHRDALSTPWGFRLTGGKDFKLPLTVQRVFVGSPADGTLQRGDVLVAVENHDCAQLLHKEAMDIIKSAGGSVSLRIKRSASRARTTSPPPTTFSTPAAPQYVRSRPSDTSALKPAPPLGTYPTKPMSSLSRLGGGGPMYGADYSHHGGGGGGGYRPQGSGGGMLHRVQQTLDHAVWEPGRDAGYEEEYQPASVHDLKKSFTQPAPPYQDTQIEYAPHDGGEEDEDYEQISVRDIRKRFNKPDFAHQSRPMGSQYRNQSAFRKPVTPSSSSNFRNPMPLFRPAALTEAARTQQNRPLGASRPFRKPEPDLPSSMLEPGWTPARSKQAKSASFAKGMPLRPCPPPVNRPDAGGYAKPQEIHHIPDEPPAWIGTLSSSGGPRPWEMHAQGNLIPGEQRAAAQSREMQRPRQRPAPAPAPAPAHVPHHSPASVQPHHPRVQSVHHGPGGRQVIEQHDAATHEGDAKVAHLQYNTPIGLYSRENVQNTLEQQTKGGAGYGTMQVTGTGTGGPNKTYNPAQSSVFALIAEEEGRKQKPRGYALRQPEQAPTESARYQEHGQGQEMQYGGYQDHSRQSRSMQALEAHMQAEGEGTSDF